MTTNYQPFARKNCSSANRTIELGVLLPPDTVFWYADTVQQFYPHTVMRFERQRMAWCKHNTATKQLSHISESRKTLGDDPSFAVSQRAQCAGGVPARFSPSTGLCPSGLSSASEASTDESGLAVPRHIGMPGELASDCGAPPSKDSWLMTWS